MFDAKKIRLRLKHAHLIYLNKRGFPSAIFLLLVAAFTLAALPRWSTFVVVTNVLSWLMAVAFLGSIYAIVWNFIKKRWAAGVISLILLSLCVFAAFVAICFLMVSAPSEDGFADNLTIPDNIEIAEPLNKLSAKPGEASDSFQKALLAALDIPGGDDPTITANVANLMTIQENAREVLKRYLATNSSWRVFTERGKVFATRRWMIGSAWNYDLHGYYSRHDIGSRSETGMPDFQTRFTIGLSGTPWVRYLGDATRLIQGETLPVELSIGNSMHESLCIISAGDLIVEVFEQSDAKERRLTKASLAHLENELAPLAAQLSWGAILTSLPPDSMRRGKPSLDLRNSYQPGIYDSIIWVNPGEPGMLYLQAFEVTKETPLSIDRLKEKSNEWVGWSDDPEVLFFSNTHFTLYEGDWGKPYATRFEVWFTPDSGGTDRKLLEKVFRIKGWQK